jgi:hypothetical protein
MTKTIIRIKNTVTQIFTEVFTKILLTISFVFVFVFVSTAQKTEVLSSVNNLLTQSVAVLLNLIELLNIFAFVLYIWVLISFLIKRQKGDAEGMKQFQGMLLWGVIAMFFLVAVWGLVYFISGSLGIGIGGCTSRPSSIPGQAAKNECNSSSSPSQPQDENESKRASCILNGGNWIKVSNTSGYCEGK